MLINEDNAQIPEQVANFLELYFLVYKTSSAPAVVISGNLETECVCVCLRPGGGAQSPIVAEELTALESCWERNSLDSLMVWPLVCHLHSLRESPTSRSS